VQIELLALELEHVARRTRDDARGPERLPQLRDVYLEGSRRGRRWALAPEGVDQAILRDDLVRVQQEEGEQGPLLSAAHGKRARPLPNLQRAEDFELHCSSTPAGL
jgi:hypothetical protein